MKGFVEDFQSSEQDALDAKCCDFDWEELERSLGEDNPDQEEGLVAKLSFALRQVMEFIIDVDLERPEAMQVIARRCIGVLWTINPDYFNGLSLTRLAELLGCSTQTLSKHSADWHRKYGIGNRGQSHGHNFKAAIAEAA